MVRKGKDLFVLLAERQAKSKSRGKDGGGRRSTAPRDKSGGSRVEDVGATLGRWVQGAVRTMRGGEAAAERGAKGKDAGAKDGGGKGRGTSSRRRSGPLEVPKGLLVPGWLLVGMVVVGLGSGFAIGRVTAGIRSDTSLEDRSGGATPPGRFQQEEGVDLSAEEETAVRGAFFFICKSYDHDEAGKAAARSLARAMRQAGLRKARIRELKPPGMPAFWAAICYVSANPAPPGVTAELDRLTGPLQLDRKTYPGLFQVKK